MISYQAKTMIEDLAKFGVPVLLFSGGEPLIRKDIFNLASFASNLGLKCALSTNGTLINRENTSRIKKSGFSYVGISLDGIGKTNDIFRGMYGAYSAALQGIRNCLIEGIRTGVRFTVTKQTYRDLKGIFRVVKEEKIQQLYLYHLVYVGRGSDMLRDDLSTYEMRELMNHVLEMAADFHSSELKTEILTVDNHADGPYLYLRMIKENSHLATSALDLLKLNEGNSSGVGIGCIDSFGYVYPDQFWRHYTLGNVKERRFSDIWTDMSEPLLSALRRRKGLLKGRCSQCKFLDICNGNLRVRAETVHGDIWASDPACYLIDQEIGVD